MHYGNKGVLTMRKSLGLKVFSAVLLTILCSGCAIGPDYKRADLELPANYTLNNAKGKSIANSEWWELFEDEKLVELINIALRENKDIAMAAASIEEASAMLGIELSNQFPSISYSGAANRYGLSKKTFSYAPEYNDFGLLGNLSFELDVWGRLRRATEAKRAQLLATEYSYQAITIELVASVAKIYLNLIDLDQRVKIAERTLKNRKDATKLIRSRFQGGVVPELDVNQAEIEEGDAAVTLAGFRMQRKLQQNALSVLLGRYPFEIKRAEKLRDDLELKDWPVGVPADLLLRRPDILAEEEVLHANTALIGVARASQLPVIGINGFLGFDANKIENVLNKKANTWNIASNFAGPLFDFGRSAYQVDAAKARTEQALKSFEKKVLVAVQEVDDALASIQGYKEEYLAWRNELKAARNASRLSRARYDDGVTPYLEVLDVERSLFQAELGETSAKKSYLTAIVDLYKALGGGWCVDKKVPIQTKQNKGDEAKKTNKAVSEKKINK